MVSIDDFALMGFWPLNEPSGSPLWYNYSDAPLDPANCGRSSGIFHHMHVTTTNIDTIEPRSMFPGRDTVAESISGTTYQGLRCWGTFDRTPDNDGPFEKALYAGISSPREGLRGTRMGVSCPQVSQSGFTVGFWVLPLTDGRLDPTSLVTPRTESSPAHALVSQGIQTQGFALGVSGFLRNDARASEFVEDNVDAGGRNRQLRAYAHLFGSNDSQSRLLDTPIESGRFTHITASYRFNSINVSDWVMYKDGRIVGSGNTLTELTETGSTSFSDLPLCLGGMAQTAGNRPEWATGFGHMISGVYAFRRVLHEGEVLELHNQGGLQPGDSSFHIPEGQEITIDDTDLIGYYPFLSVGYPDASRHRNPLMYASDEGQENVAIGYTGPFGRAGLLNDGSSNPTQGLSTGSGTNELLRQAVNADGFSVAFWIEPEGLGVLAPDMMCSIGGHGGTSLSSPALSGPHAGFVIAVDDEDGSNTIRTKVAIFNGNNPSDVILLSTAGTDQIAHTLHHVAFIYDNLGKEASLYLDGTFQSVVPVDMSEMMTNLIGSGLSMNFLGCVDEDNPQVQMTNGGQDSAISEILIMGRPLNPKEIAFLSQSGIDLSKNYYTPNDPRLRCYWPCTETNGDNAVISRDRARIWGRAPIPLTRATPEFKWTHVLQESAGNAGPFIKIDLFGEDGRPVPEELESYGNLGITSGIWSANGASFGLHQHSAELDTKSSLAALAVRYRPVVAQRNTESPFFHEEYILSFEVTPSGNIPDSAFPDNREFNSMLFSYSNGLTSFNREQFCAYLTTINAENPDPLGQEAGTGGSGVSIAFLGIDGNPGSAGTVEHLISGVLPFGIPSRVMFHMKPLTPHTFTETTGGSVISLNLYIDGNKVNSREVTTINARIWTDAAAGGTSDDFPLEFGGYATDDFKTQEITSFEGGLGENYLREIFIAKGQFSSHDLQFFSQSGIARSSTLAGFDDVPPVSLVRVNDSRLQGYYRFTAGVGGSGHMDLSNKENHLSNLAQEAIDDGVSIGSNSLAFRMRWVPGPLKYGRLASNIGEINGQASGVTTFGLTPSLDADAIPVFAVSGANFSDPQNGFSVGFWYCTRRDEDNNDYRAILSFGKMPNSSASSFNQDSSWAIIADESENIKLHMSKDGVMYVDAQALAAKASTLECGLTSVSMPSYRDVSMMERQRIGFFSPAHTDSWQHMAWTFDASTGVVKCFLNGEIVDERLFATDGVADTLNVPTDPTEHILSIMSPMSLTPWVWDATFVDDWGVLTDLFYFNSAIDDTEIRYIAQNGIAEADTPRASGMVGGHIFGSNVASGIIGGWLQGFDTASGIMGSYLEGAFQVSGIAGGYVSGIPTPTSSGFLGGYVVGQGVASGLIGGYIRASELASGLYGGFILSTIQTSGFTGGWINGGLSGTVEFDGFFITEAITAQDFDSMVEIMRTSSSDFDAKVEVFQAECPPEVTIITPSVTVSGQAPPFNQYFVATASGVQGKSIVNTRWSFGDFTGFVAGSESGSNPNHYAIQHRFAGSGFYVVKFEAIDSDGMLGSATRYVHAASGIDPVKIALSGIPQVGEAALLVQFDQNTESIPADVGITTSLLDLGNGQSTTLTNPLVSYTEPGIYRPVWCVRDTRGVIWCDSLEPGIDQDQAQNESGM